MTALALEPPPPWPPWPCAPLVSTTLAQCLLLAVLLHLLLVLLLGSAPEGTARPREGVWGAINVTLRGPAQGDAQGVVAPLPEQAGPPGTAPSTRQGGAVREEPLSLPALPPTPGAAQLGDWAPVPVPAPLGERQPEPAAAALPLGPPLASLPPSPSPSPSLLPHSVPMPGPKPVPSALPAPAVSEAPAPASESSPGPAAVPEASAVERRLQSPLQRGFGRSVTSEGLAIGDPPAEALRGLGSLVSPRPMPAPVPVPVTAPPVPAPVPTPVPADLPAPVPTALPTPIPDPAPPAAVLPPTAPAAAAPAPLPEDLSTLQRAELPATPLPQPALTRPTPASLAPELPALQPLPSSPLPMAAAPASEGLASGKPNAGAQVGHDVATAPSAPASAPPRLNLELPRQRGGELSRHSSPGVLPVLPRPPELPSKLARDIEKSAKEDCRNAYSSVGVLAVVPLLVDSVRKDGCKW